MTERISGNTRRDSGQLVSKETELTLDQELVQQAVLPEESAEVTTEAQAEQAKVEEFITDWTGRRFRLADFKTGKKS